ncbi:hypothetical protein [Nocardia brasiliensis]|nr:hypothetical protein [Nocardia brasiliensis]
MSGAAPYRMVLFPNRTDAFVTPAVGGPLGGGRVVARSGFTQRIG